MLQFFLKQLFFNSSIAAPENSLKIHNGERIKREIQD